MTKQEELEQRLNGYTVSAEEQAQIEKGKKQREDFLREFPLAELEEKLNLETYCIGRGDKHNFCWWIEYGTDVFSKYSCAQCDSYGVYYEKEKNQYRFGPMLKGYRSAHLELSDEEVARQNLFEPLAAFIKTKGRDQRIEKYLNKGFLLKALMLYYPNEFAAVNKVDWLEKICAAFELEKGGSAVDMNQAVKQFVDKKSKDFKVPQEIVTKEIIDMLELDKKADMNEVSNKNVEAVGLVEELIGRLKKARNLVLTGAPGTGKTRLAKEVAQELTGDETCVEFVQFHPSFDYTDFVEGLRPIKDEEKGVSFVRQDGIFKAFCKRAVSDGKKSFVFIIDEINRGDLSKIFGELFFAIDPGYRGVRGRVETQYANMIEDEDEFKDGFYVPENVYIIGTMNDIDRSVESMDFAVRRRFTWREIEPEERLGAMMGGGEKFAAVKGKMESLNREISAAEGLGKAFQIGPAYFLHLKDYEEEGDAFGALWKYHLEPLLNEYVRGFSNAAELMEKFEAAYRGL